MPALSNRMTSRPDARISVTAGSQLSRFPVKCCRQTRGCAEPPPKRRYAYVSFFTWRNCVGTVMLLGTIVKVDISIHPPSKRRDHAWLMRGIPAFVIFTSRVQLFLLRSGNYELHDFAATGDRPVNCVRQFEAHFVRAGLQPHEDHRFAAAVDRGPGLVVQEIVQMTHSRRHFQSGFTEHR